MKRICTVLVTAFVLAVGYSGTAFAAPAASPAAFDGESASRAVWHTDSYWPDEAQCRAGGHRIEHLVSAWTCVYDDESPHPGSKWALRVLD